MKRITLFTRIIADYYSSKMWCPLTIDLRNKFVNEEDIYNTWGMNLLDSLTMELSDKLKEIEVSHNK